MGSQKIAIRIPRLCQCRARPDLDPGRPPAGLLPREHPSLSPLCNFPLCKGEVVSVQNTETAVPLPDDKTGKDGVQRRTNVRWKMFLLLLVLVAVNYIDRGSISVALPIIQKEFNLAPGARGPPALRLLLDLRPHAGPGRPPDRQVRTPQGDDRLLRRLGRRNGSPGLAGGFLSMFIARLGIGVTEAGVMPAGGKLNAIWMHKSERGRGATILDAGAPLGAGLGGILIASLIASTAAGASPSSSPAPPQSSWAWPSGGTSATIPASTAGQRRRGRVHRGLPRRRGRRGRTRRQQGQAGPAPLPEVPFLLGHVLRLAGLQRRLLRPADLGTALPGPGQRL